MKERYDVSRNGKSKIKSRNIGILIFLISKIYYYFLDKTRNAKIKKSVKKKSFVVQIIQK